LHNTDLVEEDEEDDELLQLLLESKKQFNLERDNSDFLYFDILLY
jgi:hypothetical protein